MFESEGSRRPANTRGDTPVDMIRYTDRGHVPPNCKKVRSVVGKSNRHEADPSTNGRSGYRGYTPTPTPSAFNRTINTSTTFHNSANTSFTHSGNASAILARAGGMGESSAHKQGTEIIRPTSITPTTFLHSTRPASSLATVGANTIPTLKEDDRAVDSLNNLMRDSAMITKSPSALIHLGGTRYDSAELIRGGGEKGGGGSGTASRSAGWKVGDGNNNNNSSERRHPIGAPMPDPRYVLDSVRREREGLGEGLAHHHQHQHHYGGLAGAVPMATTEDSRSRVFKARAGSALGVGASEDYYLYTNNSGHANANNDTSASSSPRTCVNISVGLPAVHGAAHNGVIGFTQYIGGGSLAAMRSTGGYSANGTTSEAVGNARKKPDPFFFSQRHEGDHPEADPSGLVRRTRFTNGNATFNGDPLSYPAATSASTALLYGGSRNRNPFPTTDTVGQSMPCYERSSSAYGNGGGGGNINSLDTHTSMIMNGTRGSAAAVRAHSSLARLRGTGQGWGSTASSSAQFHNVNQSIKTRPQVFEDIAAINNTSIRPKLRFELTDYHNSFVNFQAPPTSAMSTTASIRFSSADRGLGSTLLGQEDKLKKSARAAAHAEVIRGTEERVRENVNAEGARMRRLREARGGLPTY